MIFFFTGPMFAGKTSEAIKRATELAGKRGTIGYFKPQTDTRAEGISTHNGQQRPATVLRNLTDCEHCYGFDVVVIDELQFFEPFIINAVKELSLNGKTVLLTGLNLWHDGTEPERVQELRKRTAAMFVNLTANCVNGCAEPATRTVKLADRDALVSVGGADQYVPACKTCWENAYA